jgi:hypothetical protein
MGEISRGVLYEGSFLFFVTGYVHEFLFYS